MGIVKKKLSEIKAKKGKTNLARLARQKGQKKK